MPPFVLLALLAAGQSEAPLVLHVSEARLTIVGRELAPIRSLEHATPGHTVGSRVLSSDRRSLTARDRWTDEVAWSVPLREGEKLGVLAENSQWIRFVSDGGDLLTIDLADGACRRVGLASLVEAGTGHVLRPMSLVEVAEGVVLAVKDVPTGARKGSPAARWSVIGASPDLSTVHWTREVDGELLVGEPGASLLAPSAPFQASPGSGLVPLGDDVLFADDAGTLLRLDARTGDVRARLSRVWEFERGFVGPSVWCHCLSRFGDCEDFLGHAADPPDLAERRAAFEREHVGYLLAGPYAVSERRILVAAARAPRSEWSQYLADCWVYELDERLEPLAVSVLPFLPFPGLDCELPGALLLAGEGASIARFTTSSEDPREEFGHPGGYDARLELTWLRKMATEETPVWMRFSPTAPFPLLGERGALLVGGGAVADKEAREMRFPLAWLTYETGLVSTGALIVPLEGEVKPPLANYRSTQDAEGHESFEVHGAGPAQVFARIEAEELVFTSRDASGESRLAFTNPGAAPGEAATGR